MPQPLEILKFLPKTNCKKCGYASCLAFAFALSSGAVDPTRCPELDPALFPSLAPEESLPDEDYAWKVLEEVKKKAQGKDWEELAPALGLEFLPPKELLIPYLDGIVRLRPEEARREDGLPLDPRDQILLYNYVFFAGKVPLSGEFVGLESFPHSLSKVSTLRRYAEEKLAQGFTGRLPLLQKALEGFRFEFPSSSPGDLAFVVWVLPRVPLRVHFFEGEEEEGLSPEVKILYDAKATAYLDLESLVFCAERLVERLLEKAGLET